MNLLISQLLALLLTVLQNPGIPAETKLQMYQQVIPLIQQGMQAETNAVNTTTKNDEIKPEISKETAPTLVPAPTISIIASPSIFKRGEVVELSWSSVNATSCTGFESHTGWNKAYTTSGKVWVSPRGDTSYELKCTGPGGTIIQSTSVRLFSSGGGASA